MATIEVEVVLGLWLLSGWSPRWAWAVALWLFSVFACVSLYLALAGQASCSCFGRLAVSPWVSFGVDVAAVAALLLLRPARAEEGPRLAWARQVLKTAAVACLLVTAGVGVVLFAFADPAEALAWFRGEAITVDPTVHDVGEGSFGEERTFRVTLTNRTKQPVRFIGGTTECSCIATKDLPLTLTPGEAQAIEVSVRFAGSPGRFQRLFVLLTDQAKAPGVVARFSGKVLSSPE